MLKNLIAVTLILQFSFGQVSQKGAPYSYMQNIENNLDVIMLPIVNEEAMLAEDLYRSPGTPYRYGFQHKVNYSSQTSGIWEETNDGGFIWRIHFSSTNAYAMGFEFEQFHIPQGGELYIYTPDYKIIHGAYTSLNNTESHYFSTPLIKGDSVIIEYYQSGGAMEDVLFNIVEIIHDYKDIMNYHGDGRDWECGINVICEEQDAYQPAINSVAFLDMGGFICSGAMVNNVRQDLTPYFLTAWHCVDGDNPSTFRFYFHKEATACENTWSSLGEYAYSSDLVADSDGIEGGDWALLLITDEIDEDWNVFYAGWDATGDHPRISCGVHHPGGSGKKINYDDDISYGTWWEDPNFPLTHWQVNWDTGGTEGGSSGAPLFNERFQIVGQLTGGAGECGEGYPDLYGKFSLGWNWELESNRRMIDWLDPEYLGDLVIEGTYVVVEETVISGDLNSDDVVNILDIIVLANLILSSDFNQEADLNNDGNLNILDIVQLVNIILVL